MTWHTDSRARRQTKVNNIYLIHRQSEKEQLSSQSSAHRNKLQIVMIVYVIYLLNYIIGVLACKNSFYISRWSTSSSLKKLPKLRLQELKFCLLSPWMLRERERLPDRQIKTECDNVASVAAVSVAAEHARKMFLNEILLHRTAESVGQTLSTSSTTTWFIVPSASWEVDLRFRNACIRYACNDWTLWREERLRLSKLSASMFMRNASITSIFKTNFENLKFISTKIRNHKIYFHAPYSYSLRSWHLTQLQFWWCTYFQLP